MRTDGNAALRGARRIVFRIIHLRWVSVGMCLKAQQACKAPHTIKNEDRNAQDGIVDHDHDDIKVVLVEVFREHSIDKGHRDPN